LAGCADGGDGGQTGEDAAQGADSAESPDSAPDGGASDAGEGADDAEGGAAADAEVQEGLVLGCAGAEFAPVPEDPGAPGPWPVGARTVEVEGLTTEVWYPAVPGSELEQEPTRYDIRLHLPPTDQTKIPDEANPWQPCACFRDLPLADSAAPFPVVLFVHGTAGFRSQTLTQMVHWASRGFVVVSSDHPGMELADILVFNFGNEQTAQAKSVLAALRTSPLPEPLSFLEGRIDAERFAVSGHSAGGGAAGALAAEEGVLVSIPMAAGGADPKGRSVNTLVMAGADDAIVTLDQTLAGYDSTPAPKRLVVLGLAGHLAFSDICAIGTESGSLLEIAQTYGVEVNPLIADLAQDGCKDGQLAPADGFAVINAASTLALEESLKCRADAASRFDGLLDVFPQITDLRAALSDVGPQ
jgi:dienelactone hydrolase